MDRENPVRVALRVANDMVHDVAAGAWPGAALAMWMVHRGAAGMLKADELDSLVRSWSWIFTFMMAAIVLQLITGVARFGHRKSPVGEALAKHAVFVVLFAVAAWQTFAVLQV